VADEEANTSNERNLLCALMWGTPSTVDAVTPLVSLGTFSDIRHREIFAAVTANHGSDLPTTPDAIANTLRQSKVLTRAGGLPYLAHVYDAGATGANATYYAGLVARAAELREAEADGIRLKQAAETGDLAAVERVRTSIAERGRGTTTAAAQEWHGRMAAGGSFVLDMPDLPAAVWGSGQEVAWAQGEALMLCGPAGVGKTTVAVQLVAGRLGIGDGRLFGLPIRPGARRTLYLAMDRPPQISRAMSRLFDKDDRQDLDDRLVIWKGPPPDDLARRPETLAMLCDRAQADTVIVDSLKDGVLKLSDDEAGGGYNKARQRALVEGIEVLELHHQRKAGGDNKKPTRLDDVYGSTWITAGAGSVFVLWGEPGDPVVEMTHLKQPLEPLGPWMVLHDHVEGRSRLHHPMDVLMLVRNQRQVGMSARLLASLMFSAEKPKPAEIEKARRKLTGLVHSGHLISRPGTGQELIYFLSGRDNIDGGESA
jgi:replicative DNA helicase